MNLTGEQQLIMLQKKKHGDVTLGYLIFESRSRFNILTSAVMREFEEKLKSIYEDSSLDALIILSGKSHTFISGADLHQIGKFKDAQQGISMSRQGQHAFNMLRHLPIPTVVGVHGVCLGGGLEAILCCHKRVASTSPTTIFALPEVKLGFVPGLGGTQRLGRLVGLKAAVDILIGESIDSQKAKEIGLIDVLVPEDDLVKRVEQEALNMVHELRKSPNYLKELVERTDGFSSPFLEDAQRQKTILAVAERSIRLKSKGNYPAAGMAIDILKRGLEEGIDKGLELEAEAFGTLAVSEVSRNLVNLFFVTEFANQSAKSLVDDGPASAISTVGIVGGGTMGQALTQHAALKGYKVLLKTVSDARSQKVLESVRGLIGRSGAKQKLAPNKIEEAIAAVKAATSWDELAGADIVLEAVAEDFELKTKILAEISKVVRPNCLIATNTSSLPIAELASAVQNKSTFLGAHFFYPVDKMPLVELVTTEHTSKESQEILTGFLYALDKTSIACKDGPGFLVNRLLCCYLMEMARLIGEKVPPNWIEESILDFGMPMGPIELLDEVGQDVAWAVTMRMYEAIGERMTPPAAFFAARELHLEGKKTGKGFYLYDANGKRTGFNPLFTDTLGLSLSPEKVSKADAEKYAQRLILTMVDEAARCLEEKVVQKPREVDLAMVLGIGFPPFRGGLLRYADSLGIEKVIDILEDVYAKSTPKRTVSNYLLRLKNEGRRFFSRG